MKVSKYTMMVVTLVMSFGLSAHADQWSKDDPNMGKSAVCPLTGHVVSSTAPRDAQDTGLKGDAAKTKTQHSGHGTSDNSKT